MAGGSIAWKAKSTTPQSSTNYGLLDFQVGSMKVMLE